MALVAVACLTLAPATGAAEPPRFANYYSAQKPKWPPFPFNPFPELPVYQLDQWSWVYDDSQVNYEQIAMERSNASPTVAESNPGRTLMELDDSGPRLTISRNGEGQIEVQIVNAPAGNVYDLYQTLQLDGNSLTAAHWQKIGSGSDGQIFTFSTQPSSSAFYVLGDQDTDQDLDGLPDAYEELVTKTSPISADCPRNIYEDAINGQSPDHWFKLNDADATPTQSVWPTWERAAAQLWGTLAPTSSPTPSIRSTGRLPSTTTPMS
jgi:hypothetical protein